MEAYQYLAEIYNEMMSDVDYTLWATYLHKILQKTCAHRIFDVACGTGNITSALHHLGYDVLASDISSKMLQIAKESARQRGDQIRFVRQDIRSIAVGNAVDAIVCACDGANYISQKDIPCFAGSAFHALVDGGLLLFDISTPYKLEQIMHGQVFFDDAEHAVCIWQNEYDKSSKALTMDITVFIKQDDLFERFDEQHVQYAHQISDLVSAMKDAGFTSVQSFDFGAMLPPKNDTQRIQLVCQK